MLLCSQVCLPISQSLLQIMTFHIWNIRSSSLFLYNTVVWNERQVGTQLALLNACHSRIGYSTSVALEILIQHLMLHYYKVCKARVQVKLILIQIWLLWILSLQTSSTIFTSKIWWTNLGYSSQIKLSWETTELLQWFNITASTLTFSSKILVHQWWRWPT